MRPSNLTRVATALLSQGSTFAFTLPVVVEQQANVEPK